MFYLRLILTALRSLDSHFLRSLLATVGVLIGVASVVASMAILTGMFDKVLKDFSKLGSNLVYVMPSEARVSGRIVGLSQSLTPDDVQAVLDELPRLVAVAAPEAIGSAHLKRFDKSGDFTVVATSDSYFDIHSYKAKAGRVFTASESKDDFANVVCLGSSVAQKLFGGMDAISQTVKIRNTPYRVIGVMEDRGNVGFLNGDESVFIPVKSGLQRFFNRKWLDRITLNATDAQLVDKAQKDVASLLRRRHNIRVGQKDDFQILSQQQAMQSVNQIAIIFQAVFYSIAGISLVVGGIGIMNIMLVSVTERTREIGVRMAVGARRLDILLQFLIEALIISLIGGALGTVLGWMMADLLRSILQDMLPTKVTGTVVLIALITSTIVGVVSGIYPAYQASQKDPVEALRYE